MSRNRHQLSPADDILPLKKIRHIWDGTTPSASTQASSLSPSSSEQKIPVYKKILEKIFGMPSKVWQRVLAQKKGKTNGQQPVKKDRPVIHLPLPLRILFFPILHPIGRIIFLAFLVVAIASIIYMLRDLPSPRRLTSGENFAVSSQIFDRHGKLLYEIFADENRTPIKIDTLPPYVYQASVAIEDQNFYHHFGFDIQGLVRAIRNTIEGKRLEGGSTITQQLVKYALLSHERTFSRKIKEAILAVATELIYSKQQILEMYLNYISYGGTSVGIESAAHRYFNKSAKDLDLAEAALLAGLPQSPTQYSPFGPNATQAKVRQQEVLRRMREDKYITSDQEDAAKKEVLHFALSKTDIQAPHFVFYVRDLLYAKYGADKVEKGGLRVTTTLDLGLQNVAQASLSAEVDQLKNYRVSNGASMVVKPNTGEILAMIGSKDYFNTAEDGQVNVTLAERQPGSSIKPLMYATAFQDKLLNPGTDLLDVPTCFLVPNQKPYCPKNYDGSFHGPVTIRTALANSLNIPAVRALRLLGVPHFIDQATKMGITTWTNPANYGLSLTLGGGEVRMIDSAQAFGVLANEGVKVPLTSILKVEDYKGNVLEQTDVEQRKVDLQELTDNEDETNKGEATRVLSRAPAYLVSHILQDNTARQMEFGPHSKLVIANQVVSVKTGTTNDLKDNWTVGYTPEFLTISWVGNNDSTPMNRALVSGITGAAPIFNDIMSYVLHDQKPLWQDKPLDINSGPVCASGFPPQADTQCQPNGQDLFWTLSHPSASLYEQKDVWVHPDTGLPLVPGEPTNGLTLQHKTILSDPLTQNFCADCTQAVGPDGKPTYPQQNIDSNPLWSEVVNDKGTPANPGASPIPTNKKPK